MAKILIVDDEKDVVELLQYSLGREGHEISTAFNGLEGLQQVKSQRPDLIILDVMMPVMDGYTMSTRLLEDQEMSRIPVIVLTAKTLLRDIFSPVGNVRRYLEKPFEPVALRKEVAAVLQAAGPDPHLS